MADTNRTWDPRIICRCGTTIHDNPEARRGHEDNWHSKGYPATYIPEPTGTLERPDATTPAPAQGPARKGYRALYGGREAVARPSIYLGRPSAGIDYRWFYVSLLKDPGFGPMDFPQTHREQLKFLEPVPAPTNNW